MGELYAGNIQPFGESSIHRGPGISYYDGVFTITVPKVLPTENQTKGATILLDCKKFRGKTIIIHAQMRCNGIASDISGRHFGGKILSFYRNSLGDKTYFSSLPMRGTQHEWKPVSLVCEFPMDIEEANLVFGIQQGWGVLEFREPSYEEVDNVRIEPKMTEDHFKCEYSPELAKDGIRRGMMSPPSGRLTETDIRELSRWNANLLRYQIVDGIQNIRDLKEYQTWMNKNIDKLESLFPVLEHCQMKVIVDMHRVPGGRYRDSGLILGTAGKAAMAAYGNDARFWMMDHEQYREAYIKTWQEIARRFRGKSMIYGYDLMNEPDQRGTAKYNYWQLQYDAAKAIREIDSEVPIIVECNYWCSPEGFENMVPMPLKNIIYQVHMYAPGEYTHQGVGNPNYKQKYAECRRNYPSRQWNAAFLRKSLEPVFKFQKKYHAKILVGEFSATAWAPGAATYLQDVIDIFEENHWDWTYHAFREWSGWSVEHTGFPGEMQYVGQSDRKDILLHYFKKNITQSAITRE